MRFTLYKLGSIVLPRGVKSRGLSTLDRRALTNRGLSQSELNLTDSEIIKKRLQPRYKLLIENIGRDTSLLIFKSVETHVDDWPPFHFGSRWVAPAFLHVVLSGKFVLTVGRKKMTFKRGDVFFMNPNVAHCVEAKSLCMTLCFEVPASLATKFIV